MGPSPWVFSLERMKIRMGCCASNGAHVKATSAIICAGHNFELAFMSVTAAPTTATATAASLQFLFCPWRLAIGVHQAGFLHFGRLHRCSSVAEAPANVGQYGSQVVVR